MDISVALSSPQHFLGTAERGEVFFFSQHDSDQSIFNPDDSGHLLCRIIDNSETPTSKAKIIELASGLVVLRERSRSINTVQISTVKGKSTKSQTRLDNLKPGQPFTWSMVNDDLFPVLKTSAPVNNEGVEVYDWESNSLNRYDPDILVWPFEGNLVVTMYSQRK